MRARSWAAVGAVLLAGFEILIDVDTWEELNVSIVYGLPLVLAAASGSRRLLWALALLLVALTFIIYAMQLPAGLFSLKEPYFVNRVLAAITVLLTAGLLHALLVTMNALRARRQTAEAESGRKSWLLASMSHDLRTPLTTINLISDLIQRSADNPELAVQVRSLAESMKMNTLSLSDLLSDVLDISAVDSGHSQLHETQFALGELLGEEVRRLEPLAAFRGLRLTLAPIAPDLRLRADAVKLARIVRNLVNNAIKFTERGAVDISVEHATGSAVLIRVADTGVGISEENLRRIFEEFAPVRDSAHPSRGWGLGLAISRRLARLMDGAIEVRSSVGSGSVFTVRLPDSRVVPADGLRRVIARSNR